MIEGVVMKELMFGGRDGQGIAHLRNVDTVADPSVARRDGRWWMVLGGMHGEDKVVHLHAAEVARGDWRVVTEPGDAGLAVRLAEPPPHDAWDATGYHCPSYVRGAGVERVYYASSAVWGNLFGPYRIGFLEWDGATWVRRPEPVFVAEQPWEHGTVLEPNVNYRHGRWTMRYCAGIGDGTGPVIGTAESADGINWRRTGEVDEGWFDAVTVHDGHGRDLITARLPLDSQFTPADGLWHAHDDAPKRQVLRTTDGTPWHDAGAWKPTAAVDGDQLAVFFTTAQRTDNPYAPALGIGRLHIPRESRVQTH